ncbi:hypothetical protein AB0C27_40410 [Nonomuraea sp. NPDC048882]|uniref:hypothetical protein n=1 Tax=Nonomuraea sp. NPDC048882 TaxID=3154347 RepID=UPI0033C96801
MLMYDDDPKYQRLRRIREEEGYDGPLNQDDLKVGPLDPRAQVLDALRRTGA